MTYGMSIGEVHQLLQRIPMQQLIALAVTDLATAQSLDPILSHPEEQLFILGLTEEW